MRMSDWSSDACASDLGVFGDGPDLPLGAGALRAARPLQARWRPRCPRRDAGRHEPAHDLDPLLPDARIPSPLRDAVLVEQLPRPEPVHAADLPAGLLPLPPALVRYTGPARRYHCPVRSE